MRNQTWINAVALGVVVATISLILPACGGGGGGGGGAAGDTTRTTIGISGSLGVADVANDSGFTTRFVAGDSVDPESIHALVITITKIRMHHAGDGDDDGEEPPEESGTEEDGDGGSWIVVYDDPAGMDIDLKALDGTTSIIDTTDLPSGKYTKMEIYYENPRLTLVDDVETEITNIHVTANGRLFISQNFHLEVDGATLVLIDFGGIHLTHNPGKGGYTLTPQLRVVVNLESAEAEVEGIITSKDDDTMMIQLDNVRDVFATGDTIITRETAGTLPVAADSETPTEVIDFIELMLGDLVEVEGVAEKDGSITADTIEVELPEEETPE